MDEILKVDTVGQYNDLYGFETLHPFYKEKKYLRYHLECCRLSGDRIRNQQLFPVPERDERMCHELREKRLRFQCEDHRCCRFRTGWEIFERLKRAYAQDARVGVPSRFHQGNDTGTGNRQIHVLLL